METINRMLFEEPVYLLILLGLLAAGGVYWFFRKRTGRRAALAVVPLAMAGALLAVSQWVVTDREQIIQASQAIAADVQSERSDALNQYLTADFVGAYEGTSIDKPRAIALCASEKKRYSIRDIELSEPTLQIDGRFADMTAKTTMSVHSEELGLTRGLEVVFKLHWIKTDAGWRIQRADDPKISLQR